VIDGLGQRSSAVVIVGMGGNGKTSLAREVAARCLHTVGETPRFEAVVWVSDKDRPGTTHLSGVLDEIARTLDYPGFTQLSHDEKGREVEQLLRGQRVLIVIDNFETITDGALLAWLLRLPEPSKAVITSREYRREFRRGGWPVELKGMSDSEAMALVEERLRVLRIDRLVSSPSQLEPLLTATGGNPKALEMALGLIKYTRKPWQQVFDELYSIRGELFDDLFARSWDLLDEATRRVLLSMTLFPDSARAEIVSATAAVRGFAFDRALERLTDLSLLDVQQADLLAEPYYTLHPLVRAYAQAHLVEMGSFADEARLRWAEDLEERVRQAIYRRPYSDLPLLDEGDLAAREFLDWAYRTQRWDAFLRIHKRISSLWSIRGLFEVREQYSRLALSAMQSLGKRAGEINTLASLARLKIYLGDDAEGLALLKQAEARRKEIASEEVSPWIDHFLTLSRAIWHLYQGQPTAALEILHNYPEDMTDEWARSRHYYWIGLCLARSGQFETAHGMLVQVMDKAEELGSARIAGNSANALVEVCVAQGDLEAARGYMELSWSIARQVHDQRHIAALYRVQARLFEAEGQHEQARAALNEATDRFERLGMRRELAEARAALAEVGLGVE
jgi:tetratricopeptide (TPR) repeat protein